MTSPAETCVIYLGIACYAVGLLWGLGGQIVTHSRLVIVGLVVITLAAILACCVLSVVGGEHTSGLCALAGTGLGALAALAVPGPPGPKGNHGDRGDRGDRGPVGPRTSVGP